MVFAEEPVVLQRARILGANGLQALFGDAFEFLKFAIVDLEPGNQQNFTHRFLLRNLSVIIKRIFL
jgi:hypothetical protein